jgi:TatD DNase family protein
MHCFDAGLAQAQEAVDLGHFVSFTGIVMFENTSEVREAAKSVPIERIMVEAIPPFSPRRHTVENAANPPSFARPPHSLPTFAA